MDAPTTTSADHGTSGGNGGGGWFTPRREPAPVPTDGERETEGSSRLAALRPVGRSTQSGPDVSPAEQGRGTAEQTAAEKRIPAREHSVPAAAHRGAAEPVRDALPPLREPVRQEPRAPRPAEAAEERYSVFSPSGPSPSSAPAASPVTASEPSPDAVLIRRTMAEVGPVADKVTSYFYALLFVRHPNLRALFPAAMDTQRDRLLKALLTAAEHIDNTPVLVDYLQNLGRGHRKYGTRPEHYPAVGE